MSQRSRIPLVAVTATADASTGTRGVARVRLNEAYVEALVAAGLAPVIVPPLADPAHAARILDAVDGLVLSGGEDVDPARYGRAPHPALGTVHAARDASELVLLAAARERAMPVLAICRGVQLLNVALGGTLVQDLASERPASDPHEREPRDARVHAVEVAAGSRLAAATGARSFAVNSRHHQAIDALAPGLRVTATAPDGVVEGAETAAGDPWWVLAVQWHPEDLAGDPAGPDARIFGAFAERLRSGWRAAPGRQPPDESPA